MIEVEKGAINEPNELVLRFNIIQATSLSQFRGSDCKRHMNLHFFYFNDAGDPLYMWVEQSTSPEWIAKGIAEKRIYLFKDSKNQTL